MSAAVDSFLSQAGLMQVIPARDYGGLFTIHGELSQVVHIPLAPDQQVQCEPGTMVYCSNDCRAKVKLGGFSRWMTDGTLFKDVYHNKGNAPGYVGFSPNYPATIIPVNLDEMGGSIACTHETFLAALDPECRIRMTQLNSATCAGCCCGGLPIFMENVQARGWVFLSAHGTIMEKMLAQGEEIVVDTHAVVAVSNSVSVDVQRTGGCSTMCCGGEGIYNTALKGPGKVILTSMPIGKIRRLFNQAPPQKKKKHAGQN